MQHVERLATTVIEAGDVQRPTDARAVLIQLDVVLRQVVQLVEEVVRVQARVPPVLIRGAGKSVRARAGREVDADRAAAAHVRTTYGRYHRHRFDGVLSRRHRGEE